MENRGPILILFSGLLVLSPLAIHSVETARQNSDHIRSGIETVGADQASCAASTFTTTTYQLGCGARRSHESNRTEGAGGSLLVSVN